MGSTDALSSSTLVAAPSFSDHRRVPASPMTVSEVTTLARRLLASPSAVAPHQAAKVAAAPSPQAAPSPTRRPHARGATRTRDPSFGVTFADLHDACVRHNSTASPRSSTASTPAAATTSTAWCAASRGRRQSCREAGAPPWPLATATRATSRSRAWTVTPTASTAGSAGPAAGSARCIPTRRSRWPSTPSPHLAASPPPAAASPEAPPRRCSTRRCPCSPSPSSRVPWPLRWFSPICQASSAPASSRRRSSSSTTPRAPSTLTTTTPAPSSARAQFPAFARCACARSAWTSTATPMNTHFDGDPLRIFCAVHSLGKGASSPSIFFPWRNTWCAHLPISNPNAAAASGVDVCHVELAHMDYTEGYYISCPAGDRYARLSCTELPEEAVALAVSEHRKQTYLDTVGPRCERYMYGAASPLFRDYHYDADL